MITYQEEDAEDFKNEVDPLLHEYYAELRESDGIPFDADYNQYIDANQRGHMVCISCRDNGKVIGLTCFFLTPYLYSRKYIIAVQDLLYIAPEYRHGWTGIRLIKEAEKLLKSRGVGIINLVCMANKDHSSLYTRLGYRHSETHFTKLV